MKTIVPFKPGSTGAAQATRGQTRALRIEEVDDPAVWDALLDSHPLGSAQASAGWGVYKTRIGHSVRRLTVVDGKGKIVAMALAAMRTRWGFRLAHIAAGPLLFTDSPTAATGAIKALLNELASGLRDVVAIEPLLFRSHVLTLALLSSGMTPVLIPRQHTVVVDLAPSKEQIRKQFRRTWLQQLRKAEADPELTAVFATTPEMRLEAVNAFTGFYAELSGRKGFKASFKPAEAQDILVNDPRYVILEIRRAAQPVAVSINYCTSDTLVSFFCASTDTTSSSGANYLTDWTLINYAKDEGLRIYDCCGINPIGNPGCYTYKTGITRNVEQTGPIWAYAKLRPVQALAALALTRR